ncbi:MAG: hypothetical protein EZS28_035850 [Streblomastix strix]|uniref:Uncharacterized protein n=1 Tax=Streblomastix strix TaxID=222440 RepID=A0A5J4UES3_9EUKA|nr:MAG: hypothetical protein EZS28_035850 [Streblomastix strix]
MQETTFRPDEAAQFGQSPAADVATTIPHLILDLESDNTNAYVPALRQLLEIILDSILIIFILLILNFIFTFL